VLLTLVYVKILQYWCDLCWDNPRVHLGYSSSNYCDTTLGWKREASAPHFQQETTFWL